jgi:neurexin
MKHCFQVLVLNEDGDPSSALNNVLSPSLKPKKVTYQGLHQCELVIGKPRKPHMPSPYPEVPNVNYPPTIRNPVDHINSTVGRLLVFKVPEVTASLISLFFLPFCGVVRIPALVHRMS